MNCKSLIHPFQYDTGISQNQRVIESLLEGPAQLDGRTMADMLGYFVSFSRQINFYDEDLSVKDWQPFFQNSLPFITASILNFRQDTITSQIAAYQKKFLRRPSKAGLEILVNYLCNKVIKPFSNWDLKLHNSGLPIELVLDGLIKKTLKDQCGVFIQQVNTAVKLYRFQPIDFNQLLQGGSATTPWNFTLDELTATLPSTKNFGGTKRARLIGLYTAIAGIATPFLKAINAAAGAASISLQQSFESLKDDIKQRHQPHLALIFAFLNLFRHLQDSLNGFTKKHVDFFYRQVLAFQPKGAIPDKAHIVFAIQKQLTSYQLKKGATVKGPKDNNKADILFALDDELVVNQAQITDLRTLFVNNQPVQNNVFVEGVYMAPVATKADGLSLPFPEGGPNSWPTLGAHYSKYRDSENNFTHAYPNARLAFVMASPVLLLNEGERKITFTITCNLNKTYCPNPLIADPSQLFGNLRTALQSPDNVYYYVNQDLIKQAVKAGIDSETEQKLRSFLLTAKTTKTYPDILCYNDLTEPIYEATIPAAAWPPFSDAVKISLLPFFPPQQGLNIAFSGEKDWVIPKNSSTVTFSDLGADNSFTLTIISQLKLDEPAVTFYNKDVLKEDINTKLPAARITLNDKIKIAVPAPEAPPTSAAAPGDAPQTDCCLRPSPKDPGKISLYHFFRNIQITGTTITVQACGIKNFVVQNDESLQDVNKPIYPFGTRPTIIDFDIVTRKEVKPTEPAPADTPSTQPKNLVGPNFYIGSQEIFGKKWTNVNINLNWKDRPSNFEDYYRAYWVNKTNTPNLPAFGLKKELFQVNVAVLQKQNWIRENNTAPNTTHNDITDSNNRQLFHDDGAAAGCQRTGYDQSIALVNNVFDNYTPAFTIDPAAPLTKYEAATQQGFIRLNLQNQDFLQKDYAYVLGRQMMALSKLSGAGKDQKDPDALRLEDAVYYTQQGEPVVFSTDDLGSKIGENKQFIDEVANRTNNELATHVDPNGTHIPQEDADHIRYALYHPDKEHNMIAMVNALQANITQEADVLGKTQKNFQAIIPNEPWTPIIQGMSLDYTATALATDIDLIHLYPFANTYKKEELSQRPTIFPSLCDEGTLYLGLDALTPASNINILFQLAEATSDTEAEKVPVTWSYLDNNTWKPLRTGFEILDDATNNLSTTGIIKFAIPGNITSDNTVMPAGLSWIRASISNNSGIVAETIAIYTQAIEATFTDAAANDEQRLDTPLPAHSLAKLEVADANIKKVDQPDDSVGGRIAETDGYFYVRVSETLRHKGRAIQSCDYERIALDAFPQLFKAKCINHSLGLNAHKYANDYPMAPGFVLLAVIPDLNRLKASGSFEPRVPLSLLDELEIRMQKLTSPFVRFRAMNPRYEKVDFCLKVKLLPGKDENFYKQKLQDDIRTFMAPWSVGEFDKLRFGQVINRSDVIRFLETRDYLDYIDEWRWRHDEDQDHPQPSQDLTEILPLTPRSILVAGYIDVSIVHSDPAKWDSTQTKNPLNQVKTFKNGQLP